MLRYFYIRTSDNHFLYRNAHNVAKIRGSEPNSCRWPSYDSLFHWTGQYLVTSSGYFLGANHSPECGPGFEKVNHRAPLANMTE